MGVIQVKRQLQLVAADVTLLRRALARDSNASQARLNASQEAIYRARHNANFTARLQLIVE